MSGVYKPDEIVHTSGIYQAIHDKNLCQEKRYPYLMAGKPFPKCEICGDAVRYIPQELSPLASGAGDSSPSDAP
jgi:hypothetical protein